MKQLGLDFSFNKKTLLDDFIGDKNQQIIDFLDRLFLEKSPAVVYIYGPKSSGKTRLLQSYAFKALAQDLNILYLDFNINVPVEAMDGFEFVNWIFIDNIDCANFEQQQEVFNIYNHTTAKLIITGSPMPNKLDLLKDLKTRLSLATIFRLQDLNDEGKKLVIKSSIEHKNIRIDDKVYDYLFNHYSRNLEDLFFIINKLDKASLEQKAKVTTTFVKKILRLYPL